METGREAQENKVKAGGNTLGSETCTGDCASKGQMKLLMGRRKLRGEELRTKGEGLEKQGQPKQEREKEQREPPVSA